MDSRHLWSFALASLLLAVTPGPGVVYIVTRSIAQGRLAGLSSVLGVALGNLCNALVAGFGVSLLVGASPAVFEALRYVGAAYLLFLGIEAFRSTAALDDGRPVSPERARRVILDGFVVALLNPKTALFFAALLPQFVDPSAPHERQLLVLIILCIGIAATTDCMYALGASALRPYLLGRMARHAQRVLPGLVMLCLAAFALLGAR